MWYYENKKGGINMIQVNYDGNFVGYDTFDENEVLDELIRIKRKFGLGRIEKASIDKTYRITVLFIKSK